MKNKPIVIFTGLAVAAVAAVAGLTRDRWMAPEVAKTEQPAEATVAGSAEVKQPEPEKAAEAPAATAQEQPAAEANQQAATSQPAAEQPAVEQPAAQEMQQAATEQPAAEQPAAQGTQQATAEQPAAEQPAAQETQQAATEQPAAEQPTTQEAQQAATDQPAAEQPASQETQQAAAEQPAAEQPAAEQSAAEQPAVEETQQAETEQPAVEQPAAEETQQATAEQPAVEQPAVEEAEQPAAEPAPTFDTVRVEKTGEAVIAGQAQPGDQVEVKLDGKTIGTAEATKDGSFVVVPEQPLPEGSGALTIETKGDDGEVKKSEQAVAVIVPEQSKGDALVAVVSPNEPTKVLQKPEAQPEEPAAEAAPETEVATAEPEAQPEQPATTKPKQVSLDAVDYDAAGNIVFSGRGQAGTNARIYVDNAVVGDAPIGPDGRWVFAGTTQVAPGVHTLRIDGIDGAGKVASRIEVPFFREETSKVASAPEAEAEQPATKTDNEAAISGETETANQTVVEAEPPAAKPPEGPKEGRLIIQPGNNLWRISRVIYGDGVKYALLYEANKDQIRDPDLIYPGQVFRTPDVEPPEEIDPAARAPLYETSTQ